MFKNWIQISKIKTLPDCPITASTAYKWIHLKKYQELFRSVGGKKFLDLDRLYEMAEAGKLR